MSLTAYARRRGVSAKAVSKAVAEGRLRASVVTVNGQPKIADADAADREWSANTRARIEPQQNSRQKSRAEPSPRRRKKDLAADDVPQYETSRALREAAAARRESALADLAEIEVSEKLDEIVPVEEARAYMADKFTVVKTRILGVPTLVAQRLPHLAAEVAPVLEELLREVLEELAAEDDGDGEEEEASELA